MDKAESRVCVRAWAKQEMVIVSEHHFIVSRLEFSYQLQENLCVPHVCFSEYSTVGDTVLTHPLARGVGPYGCEGVF